MKNYTTQEVGDRLYQARKHLGLRQKDMAEKMGVGLNTWIRWEKGEIGMPLGKAAAIFALAPFRPDWLIHGEGNMIAHPPGLELMRHLREVERHGNSCSHPHAVDTSGHDTNGKKTECACAICEARKFMYQYPDHFPDVQRLMKGSY